MTLMSNHWVFFCFFFHFLICIPAVSLTLSVLKKILPLPPPGFLSKFQFFSFFNNINPPTQKWCSTCMFFWGNLQKTLKFLKHFGMVFDHFWASYISGFEKWNCFFENLDFAYFCDFSIFGHFSLPKSGYVTCSLLKKPRDRKMDYRWSIFHEKFDLFFYC